MTRTLPFLLLARGLALAALVPASAGMAQDLAVSTVREVFVDEDGDGVPDRLGEEVVVEGTVTAWRDEDGWIRAEVADRTGTIPVHVSAVWLTEPGFVDRLLKGGRARVTGVAHQGTDADPPLGDYRLIPHGVSDFAFIGGPPFGALLLAAVATLLLALVWWRRSAAGRSAQLQGLAVQLETSRDELKAREERFRSLVENATDTVTILDADGTILYISPSVTRMLGWSPEEVLGRDPFELVHREDRRLAASTLAEVRAGPAETREVEIRFRSADGAWHDLEVVATNRLDDPAVRGIVCNARDVTHHRALEQRLRQADRLEAVGRLAGGVAHDFNNILTALRGHADLALEEMPDSAPGRGDVEEIVRAAERAAQVTRQLLAFTRQQVRKSQVVSVSRVVDEMLPMLRRLIGADIEISTRLAPGVDHVDADPAQLEQVILNLVINARDAMTDGGCITVAVEEAEITGAEADSYPYIVVPGRYVRMSVSDTGSGMDDAVLARAFEPFFTTKEQGKGTGLGLAMVYGIIKQSHGYIWADSTPGEGTRFDIYLPQLAAGTPETAPDRSTAPATTPTTAPTTAPTTGEEAAGTATVLLVEDEEAVRRLAGRILRKRGYRILEAESPARALELLEAGPPVDLLLTDMVMPGMSGVELASQLAPRHPEMAVILMSGYTADEVVRQQGGDEPIQFLEKPFTPDQLLRKVQTVLQAGLARTDH